MERERERERDSNSEEKFGLFWNGKSDSKSNANFKNIYKTLEPCLDESNDFFHAKNIIIKGDNLETLKILSDSYNNKVDVIYIDPPYNTGNDFIYNDNTKQSEIEYKQVANLVDENNNNLISNVKTNGRFHTNWLNMIYPRLYLARNLLKEDGFIFISIDDNEYARLKLICDEIFGEKNFISNLIWIKKHGPGGNTTFNYSIINNTENILCYAKNINNFKMTFLLHDKNQLKKLGYVNKDEYFDKRGYYKLTHLFRPSSTGSFQYIESLDYKVKAPNGELFGLHCNKDGIKRGRYTWSYDAYIAGDKLGFIECKKNDDGDWVAYRKQYENVKFDPRSKSILNIKAGQQYENIIDGIYSSNGGNEMKKIFNDKNVFDFPKPIDLIKYLINFHPNKNALVLDFFAGSGTTGQAVMELNKEDDGNRNFILVQLEEKIENNLDYKNIAEITIDRIKKAIEKYEYEKDKKFKVFKVKDTNFKNYVFENINGQIQLDIQDDNFGLKKDTKNLSLIYEIILKKNYELNTECKEIKQNDINYWVISNKILIFLDNNLAKDNIDYSKVLSLIENYWKSLDDEIQKIGITIIFNDNYFIDDQSKVNLFLEINNLSNQIKIEVF